MTMATNAYKTQTSISDKAITELLTAGFSGLLKGWWDYYLTENQRNQIFNSVEVGEDGDHILEKGQAIQNTVSTLILNYITILYRRSLPPQR